MIARFTENAVFPSSGTELVTKSVLNLNRRKLVIIKIALSHILFNSVPQNSAFLSGKRIYNAIVDHASSPLSEVRAFVEDGKVVIDAK